MGDRFRFVANQIEVVEPLEALPKLPVARAVWKPQPDLATSAEAWLTAGGPHHTVLSTALSAEHLGDLADMLETELALIDASTNVRSFGRELRWNQAYYRLAQGF
jgi:L-arabinose isomerase